MPEKEPIGVIGVGWVGLVTAACFAELGHDVVGRDIDATKVELLKRGEVTIHEPGLAELVERNSARLAFTMSMQELLDAARLLFVCVDTPPTYSGDADLSRVDAVVAELATEGGHALVMKSTVPAGTGRTIERRLAEAGKQVAYVSNPEFLREGTAVQDFMNPDRIVVGGDVGSQDGAADAVAALYEPLGAPILRTDVASAEMTKLASNAFLATKISFINEIANVCEEVGADVSVVADGMGLDPRIGPRFLQAGIGYGGSCLVGDESVLARRNGRTRLIDLEELFGELYSDPPAGGSKTEVAEPKDLEVLSWRAGDETPLFRRVSAATRRPHAGNIVEVCTKMGRRLRCTPDHPFVVGTGERREAAVKLAAELGEDDWLPIAQGLDARELDGEVELDVLTGVHAAGLEPEAVIVRPAESEIEEIVALSSAERNEALDHSRGARIRLYDVVRSGALRLSELERLELSAEGASVGTARNGTYVPTSVSADEAFWRVVGLYIAEGHCSVDGQRGKRHRLCWSFHPTAEMDLVDAVATYWRHQGVKATVRELETTTNVVVSSRLLASWWLSVLGLGKDCYTQRIPDIAWSQPESHKRALLAGLWRGDGSWSYVSGGPSVVLEYGTVSRELADGILRLLGELGIVARLKVGRTTKSTVDTYWLVISGAEQVERALFLVPEQERSAVCDSLARQAKRIAPTGYRRDDSESAAWVRVTGTRELPFSGSVYSLEIPGAGTFVATGGLVVHNCFPKDVAALKQLAGNSGYHFQLLTAVIEVNELQKRRVIGKLRKHLGSLVGKRVALLGLAFKPDTDDLREASSLVLAGRLQGEGAHVRAYDPVAEPGAEALMAGTEMCETALDALDGADAAVLVTEWPEFGELPLDEAKKRMANPLVIDGRNFLDRQAIEAAGFTYEGVGR